MLLKHPADRLVSVEVLRAADRGERERHECAVLMPEDAAVRERVVRGHPRELQRDRAGLHPQEHALCGFELERGGTQPRHSALGSRAGTVRKHLAVGGNEVFQEFRQTHRVVVEKCGVGTRRKVRGRFEVRITGRQHGQPLEQHLVKLAAERKRGAGCGQQVQRVDGIIFAVGGLEEIRGCRAVPIMFN